MRQAAYAVSFLTILFGLVWIVGCGDVDVLDETNQRYSVDVTFDDEGAGELAFDVLSDECDGNLTILGSYVVGATVPESAILFDDEQTMYGVLATVTITVDSDAPGLVLEGYEISYTPKESQYGGGLAMPPDLDNLNDNGNYNLTIASGESSTFSIECLTVDTKEEYVNKAGMIYYYDPIDEDSDGDYDYAVYDFGWDTGYPDINEARYTIKLKFDFEDEFGEEKIIEVERTIWLGNYACE